VAGIARVEPAARGDDAGVRRDDALRGANARLRRRVGPDVTARSSDGGEAEVDATMGRPRDLLGRAEALGVGVVQAGALELARHRRAEDRGDDEQRGTGGEDPAPALEDEPTEARHFDRSLGWTPIAREGLRTPCCSRVTTGSGFRFRVR
jgi:hypothetical protein